MTATVGPVAVRARQDRLEPDRHVRPGRGAVRRRRRVPGARPAVRQPDRHDLARARAAARHRRPAAHPDAVLHGPEREGRALVGRLGRRADRRLLRDDHVPRASAPARCSARRGRPGSVDEAGNLAAPLLAQSVGGGEGSIGGDAFLAIIAAVAFATILAVVAGLVISASGAVAHDVWSNVIRKGRGLRARGGLRRAHRRRRHRRDRDRDRDRRRLGPERLLHGRAGVRGRRERELPGAAAGADLEAVQHHRRRDRRRWSAWSARSAWCSSGPTCASRSADRAEPAGDHLGPARVPGLHPRHAALARPRTRPRAASTSCRCAPRPGSARRCRSRRCRGTDAGHAAAARPDEAPAMSAERSDR